MKEHGDRTSYWIDKMEVDHGGNSFVDGRKCYS